MLRCLAILALVFLGCSSAVRADFLADQQREAHDRAAYWAERGYKFDASVTSAFSMNEKVKDIERARYWAAKGYTFNPDVMTAFSMDQKVTDIQRAKFWAAKGYTFNPDILTAFSMDQKVHDIDRARFWAAKGYHFDPDILTAFSMDQKVLDIERAKFWAARGYDFNPDIMTAYTMDMEASQSGPTRKPQITASPDIPVARPVVASYPPPRALPAFPPLAQSNSNAPAALALEPTARDARPSPLVAQDASPVSSNAPQAASFTAGMLQPLTKPADDPLPHAPPAKGGPPQQ